MVIGDHMEMVLLRLSQYHKCLKNHRVGVKDLKLMTNGYWPTGFSLIRHFALPMPCPSLYVPVTLVYLSNSVQPNMEISIRIKYTINLGDSS